MQSHTPHPKPRGKKGSIIYSAGTGDEDMGDENEQTNVGGAPMYAKPAQEMRGVPAGVVEYDNEAVGGGSGEYAVPDGYACPQDQMMAVPSNAGREEQIGYSIVPAPPPRAIHFNRAVYADAETMQESDEDEYC
jgi:hypothetical protein